MAAGSARSPERDRLPVMTDVARLAGVSHQTVSRVLNDHPNVRAETRNRVLSAIRELGYRRNAAARTLVTRRTNTLAVVTFNTILYGPASMLYSIERAAKQHGYFVTVAALDSMDRHSVLDAVERLRDQAVDGVIVIAPQTTAVAALAQVPATAPLVVVGCGTQTKLNSVAVDNEAGARKAIEHLLDLGHRTVHHLAGPDSWLDARERADGWRLALRQRGAPVPSPLPSEDWSARSGYELGYRLLNDREVTAVFCANDHMALGLLLAAAESGVRVPEDLSVVGFDDIPEARYFYPPLTTIRQDFDELGRRALGALVGLISDSPGQEAANALLRKPVAPELVVRSSVGHPRS